MDDDETPTRQWQWSGLVVELSKLPVGLGYALLSLSQAFLSMAEGIHGDILAHHNYRVVSAAAREQMALQLEML